MTEQSNSWTEPTAVECEWIHGQARMDRMLAPFGELMLDAAGLQPGETVIDVGCGTGATAFAASELVAPGKVIGLDISESMIAAARQRSKTEALRGVEWVVADAQSHSFPPGAANAAISRFGVAHFANVGKAFSNIAVGVRPGGRIVFVEWSPRQDNEWMTLPASILRAVTNERGAFDSPDNTAFGSRDRLATMLHLAGFEPLEVERAEAPMWIGSSADEVLPWFLGLREGKAIDRLPEAQRVAFGEEFRKAMLQRTDSTGVHVNGSAWIVKALKPDAG